MFDGPTIRQLIVESVAKAGKATAPLPVSPRTSIYAWVSILLTHDAVDASFASILADYLRAPVPQSPPTAALPTPPPLTSKTVASSSNYLDGLI